MAFELLSKTGYLLRTLGPMMLNLCAMGPNVLRKYCVFKDKSKTVQAIAKF